MGQKAKLSVILLIILLVVALVAAGGGFYLLQQERRKAADLQDELESVKASEKLAKKQLEDWQSKYNALDIKLADANKNIDGLKSELLLEVTAKQESQARIEQLKIDLEQQKTLRGDLEKKFAQVQKDVESAQAQVKELAQNKKDLEAKVKQLETQGQGVELGKIVVGPEGQPVEGEPVAVSNASVASEGKVLVVNNDHNFVVFNLGSKNGVKAADVYSVFHGNKNLGDVKVEKVQDNMAAAGFISSNLKGKISEGDRIVPKAK